nr:hypothetical protein [Candidatus Sigynarchaeota archaeon]
MKQGPETMSQENLTPRQIGDLIEDLREDLEETRMEVNLLDGRLNRELTREEYNKEKSRLDTYMKGLITRITELQKSISKKDRDLAREIRQLMAFFQIEELENYQFIIYLAAGPEHIYTIPFSLANFPERPDIQWPQEVFDEIGDPSKFIKQLRGWDPGYPPQVYEIFQSFESYAFNYYNAVGELKNELRDIEGEYASQLIRDNYMRITLFSFNKAEYHVEINLERYPDIEWTFTPAVEQILGPVADFMARYAQRKDKPKMLAILRDISWEIDKINRLS